MDLEQILGYSFRNKQLLITALTHSSYAYEVYGNSAACNERLEFLGDAVLDMAVSNYFFNHFRDKAEGDLTKLRASVVCEGSLAAIGKKLGIADYMFFGKGEEHSGGKFRDSIVADCMEAVIGAIYEDGGPEAANEYILRIFKETMEDAVKGELPGDAKSSLQEYIQKKGPAVISYRLLHEEGPDHAKIFEMSVSLNGKEIGRGAGKSKKKAEAAAAADALTRLRNAF